MKTGLTLLAVTIAAVVFGSSSAQAYYFEVTWNTAGSNQFVNPTTWDTHGDQFDVGWTQVNHTEGNKLRKIGGTITLYSDYGVNNEEVDVSLTHFITGTVTPLSPSSDVYAFTNKITVGGTTEPFVKTRNIRFQNPDRRSLNRIFYDDLIMETGVTYNFAFVSDLASLADLAYLYSLDVNQEETAPTPIPGAVWLLGSGLVGLLGLRKRSKTA